ncbi:hypothetical protein [Roseisolibacter sp. H3M3-2]|uniref:hypothetical protein n=1 Tax=Roseisolibacter sp. H3M3-2 TaxID=3031323 RepID=UPI0023DCD3CB|nr:hypothetical protein [Roseisolibacter sp. H3M3-2]MDF1502289.1 hypothetical protein [Roseisolibacter sp. H3M3-2]
MIVTPPGASAVTSPPALTVATAASLLRQVSVAVGTVTPLALRGVAISCTVLPTSTGADGAPATTTDAT